MTDPIDAIFDEWCQTCKALRHAFYYDNLLPIDEIHIRFAIVWGYIRRVSKLSQRAKSTGLSAREQTELERLLRNRLQAKLEELIEHLNRFRAEWSQDHHPVNDVTEKLRHSRLRTEWHREQCTLRMRSLQRQTRYAGGS